MNNWLTFLLDHYSQRLKEETRPEAKQFLRQTLNQLKNVSPVCNHSLPVWNSSVLESHTTHIRTQNFLSKI